MTSKSELNSLVDRMKKEIDLFCEKPTEDRIDNLYELYDKILDYYEENDAELSKLYAYLFDTGYLTVKGYIRSYTGELSGDDIEKYGKNYEILAKILLDYKSDNPSDYGSRVRKKLPPYNEEEYEEAVKEIAGIIIREAAPVYFDKKLQKLLERGYLTASDEKELKEFKTVLEFYKVDEKINRKPPISFYEYRRDTSEFIYKSSIKDGIFMFGFFTTVAGIIEGGLYYAYTHLSSHPTAQELVKYLGYGVAGLYGLALLFTIFAVNMEKQEYKEWERKHRNALRNR